MITLIIVDCQYDFIKGSLAVEGSVKAVSNIVRFIIKNRKKIDKIILTADWHPRNHCSFKKFGGLWPAHCIQYSRGASFEQLLFNTVTTSTIPYDIIIKGTYSDKEEYGAFTAEGEERPLPDALYDRYHVCDINPNADIVVCGIAGDYCVKETLKNILDLNPKVYLNGIASIDGGVAINDFIEHNKLEVVDEKLSNCR